jgi:hypothetical protein
MASSPFPSSTNPSALNPQPSALSPQSSVLSPQSSVLTTVLPAPFPSSSSLLFIDPTVDDLPNLLAGVAAGTEVHVLNSTQDAVSQITNTLLGREGISSIHIVSHGEAGGLDFGSGKLNLSDLPSFASEIQSWKKTLTDDADLLLYGCDVAEGELGKAFVNILSHLTGADVAASDDLTGSTNLGGNWDLEFQTGEIEALQPFQLSAQQDYNHVLATFSVTNTSDNGAGSLRQAINDANNAVGADIINFTGSVFADANPDTITLTSGNLNITSDITVQGTGAANLAISGNNASRIFQIYNNSTVSLDGLTLTNGNAASSSGGAILQSSGTTLNISNSTIRNSTATYYGGGINSDGTLNLSNSTITGNSTSGYQYGYGGGICKFNGGGTIINTTISGNSTTYGGGGVYGSNLTFINSTITNNTADSDNDGTGFGGGIYSSGSISTQNTIVAGNFDTPNNAGTNVDSPDVYGSFINLGNNLIGRNNGSNFTADGVLVGTSAAPINPLLGALADNGGPTQTHALLASSPAVNAGNNAVATTTDQRGTGFARVVDGIIDLGAIESNLSRTAIVITPGTAASEQGATPGSFTFTLSTAAPTGGLTVNFTIAGNASLPTDYTLAAGTNISNLTANSFVIAAGATSAMLQVVPVDDSVAEGDETITVRMTAAGSGYAIANPAASLAIADNDPYFVDTLVDEYDGNFSAGDLSLREAIQIAGNNGIIELAPTLAGGTLTLTQGALYLTRSLKIGGRSAANLAISGNNASRIFYIYNNATVSLDGLTVTNGNAVNDYGGAIYQTSGTTLNISNSTIRNSTAYYGGGGIFSNGGGTLNISNSTIAGNTTSTSYTSGYGGGIFQNSGTGTLTNTTISGNASTYVGGGVFGSNLTFINSTITNNTVDSDNDGTGFGGGIYSNNGSISTQNTIVAGNFDTPNNAGTNVDSPDVYGSFINRGNNLIGRNNGSNFTAGGLIGTNAAPVNPLLGTLASNGGLTQTHALQSGSLAINAGNNTGAPTTDQRGLTRPVGGTVDIGAVESSATNQAPTINLTGTAITYLENAPATLIDNRTWINDADSLNLDTGSLTVNLTANGTVDDRLAIRNQGTGTGQIGVSGSNVTYEGTAIGSFTGGNGTTPLVITLNASATPAAVQGLIQNITFANVSETPSTAARTVSFFLSDGDGGTSSTVTKTINVVAVNDAPSFTKGADQATNEDAGVQSFNNWATNLSAGPTDESGQTLNFLVSNNNNALFAVQPTIDAAGNLTYTAATNANGTATVAVQLKDNGGIANGGVDTSATQTFTITINPVNDSPSFTKGANQTINEDAGAQTVNNWATNLSSGPTNESGQTLNFLVSNNNNALFAVQPTINSSGNLTYTPAANANGTATVTVQLKDNGGTANGGVDTSVSQTFTITVNAVNDAPSFTKGADQTVNEDAGAQTVNNWATNLSAGPTNESGQTLNFLVSNSNNALFSAQPTIDSSGNLIYTPTANANGTATVTVQLKDNGGTANGGVDTSAAQTFTITVDPINDAPSFTKGADQTINEDAGAQTINNWATNLSAGPTDESGQTLNFLVSNDNNALFSAQPTIDASGNLTYTAAANANGTATVTVQLKDNGGSANGGVDTSASQTFTFTVNAVNDAPSFTKGVDQTINEDAAAQTIANWATNVSAGAANESGQTLSFQVSNNNNSLFSVQPTIDASGNLSYTPAANANGTATVTVFLKDNGGNNNGGVDTSASQTFTITVNAVNDPPSFTKGADQTINEDAGAQTINTWATNLSPGPADEAGQTTSFQVSNNNNPLFSVQPTIDSSGNLTYTPTANASGTATVTVQIQDNGGVAIGGVDTSAAQTFTITINPVNDAPRFTGDATLAAIQEDATNPGGSSITNLFGSLFSDPDQGATLGGIAIVGNTANPNIQGKWQYSTDSGTNWSDIGTVADDAAALALSATTLVRFVPFANYSGTPPALTVRALDNSYSAGYSSGTTRVTLNTSPNGGTTAIASATNTLGTSITAVDDTEFFVINTNDSGLGSLRQAILDANNDSGAETVTFTGSVFTDATPDTITLSSGELAITGDLTITGTGADKLTFSHNGGEDARVFNIGGSTTVTLDGMTIANGKATNAFGGGIRNSGNLTVRNSTLRNNMATGGAGIYNNGGTLTVINSTLSGNTASSFGGGIANVGGTLTIRNSTISGNQAIGSTLGGGAIDQYGSSANPTATIENSTIAYNTATNASASGIWLETGSISLRNTIVANNNGTNNFQVESGATLTSLGNNLTNSATSPLNQGSDRNNANPRLAPLAYNGGPTQTHALLSGSAAINTGNNTGAPTTDQRGFTRIVGTKIDIGAYEYFPQPDFTADGKIDLLWRNSSSGQNIIWEMNGTSFSTALTLPVLKNTDWKIVGSADFNGDGKEDILWRNAATAQNVVWQMNGTTFDAAIHLPDVKGAEWTIAGIADFNGDGKVDLLWRNSSSGQNAIWEMNGTTFNTATHLPILKGAEWRVSAIADFNGDNKADLLWRNTLSGQNVIWQLDSTTFSTAIQLPKQEVNWTFANAADFDGDGKVDLLWRDASTGQNVIWQLNGTTYSTGFSLPLVKGTNWKIQGVGDFDSNGTTDILWRDYTSGRNVIWQMNYTQFSTAINLPDVKDPSWENYPD